MTERRPTIAKPLLEAIERAHSRAFAERFRDYVPEPSAGAGFYRVCLSVLADCAFEPGACTLMSTLLAARLAAEFDAPVPVIAGALKIQGTYIFGSNAAIDGDRVFSETGFDWDGHVWIMFGDHIVDISLARTALSGRSHPLLERRVRSAFGADVELLVMTDREARAAGFLYLPRYVLSDAQLAPLVGGAHARYGIAFTGPGAA